MSGLSATSNGVRPRTADRGRIVAAGLMGFALVLPFLTKGVHQDDWAYLRVSRLMLEHGAEVFDQQTLYQGYPISAGQGVLHGPVWLTFLAIAQQFGQHAITVAHLFAAGLLGLLAASCASIAGRLGAPPLLTALTFVAAPAPWVLATSLMTDLPMLAFFAASVACALRGLAEEDLRALLAAGVLGALAALTRYHGFAIVPLLAVLPLLVGAPLRRGLIPAGLAGLLFFGFLVTVLAATGRWDMLRATEELSKAVIDREACLMSTVCAFGGVGIGWWVAALTSPGKSLAALAANRGVTVLGLIGAGVGAYLATRAPSVVPAPLSSTNTVLQWVCFVLGGATLAGLLWPWLALVGGVFDRDRRRELRDRYGLLAFIALWSLGFAFAAWVTVPFGSTRYVLPALPGVFLVMAAVHARWLAPHTRWVALVVTAAAGLGAVVADHHAAGIYPELADEVAARSSSEGDWAEGKTWIWGELGFRWYLEERAGLEVLPTESDAPRAGDRVLKSMILSTASPDDGTRGRYRLHPDVVRAMESTQVTFFPDAWPIRIHNSYAGAGFYGHEAGFLPWSISSTEHDRLQVWTLREGNPFYEHFEAARKDTTGVPAKDDIPPIQGAISLTRFQVSQTVPDRVAIQILLPGRITWNEVPVPEAAEFEVWVGEHNRLTEDALGGPASVFRVLVEGEVVAERRIDTHFDDEKQWYRMSADLGRWAGRNVSLAFELRSAAEAEADPPRPILLGGFADPVLRSGAR